MALQISSNIRALMPAHLQQLEPYDPRFSPCEINLSANENTHGLPQAVIDEFSRQLRALEINRYPDPLASELRTQIGARFGFSQDWVLAGNGGDELLFDLFLAFAGPGKRVVLSTPTFSIYRMYATMLNCELTELARDPKTQLANESALLEAAQGADLVIVCSPNNPTGELVSLDFVSSLTEACSGIVVVDEAYAEFAPAKTSAIPLLATCERLVVLRTFSKAFALAGARLGYVLAFPGLIAALASVRQTYSLDVLTQTLGLTVLKHQQLFEPQIAEVISERTRIYEALRELEQDCEQVKVWPSEANFLLVRLPHASKIRERLRDEWSILVRDFSAEPGLTACLRITVGTKQENDRLLEALVQLVKEEQL